MGKTRKRIWRGGKKEKGRDREPVIISFSPHFHRPSSPQFYSVFYFFRVRAFSIQRIRVSEPGTEAKYDRPREAFKSDGYLNCYSVSPIPGQQLT